MSALCSRSPCRGFSLSQRYWDHRGLHSFPTRRSSDLSWQCLLEVPMSPMAALTALLLVVPAFAAADTSVENVIRSTLDRKSTRLNSSHSQISYAVFCLKKKNCLQMTLVARYDQNVGTLQQVSLQRIFTFSTILGPQRSTLFPYTTLFRSFLAMPPRGSNVAHGRPYRAATRRTGVRRRRYQRRECHPQHARSEEHTSELQSQSNLVCRLLLEKKKLSADDSGGALRPKCRHFAAGLLAEDFHFLNDTGTTEVYTLSLHDALPIFPGNASSRFQCRPWPPLPRCYSSYRRSPPPIPASRMSSAAR